jgi:hypothetical protein
MTQQQSVYYNKQSTEQQAQDLLYFFYSIHMYIDICICAAAN